MRVGYDITAIDERQSGVGTYAQTLLGALGETGAGHAFVPLSNRPGSATRSFPSRMLWMQCVLPGEVRRLGLDLCHYTNSIGPLGHPGSYVVTIHDMTLSLMPRYHPFRKQLLIRPVVALTARRASRIITVSEHARRDIVRLLRVAPERVCVTSEAADPIFRPVDAHEQARVRLAHGIRGPYLLFVGTIEPRKNLARLVAAWARLRAERAIPHQLVLVGARGWYDQPIFEQVARCGFRDQVIFTGYVPRADLPGLYSGADAFVLPSLAEGFGLPLIEALACGTPALISATPALLEVADGAALSVDPLRIGAIAAGLERIVSDPQLRGCLHEQGLRRAAEFSWQRTANLTLGVYQEALNATRTGSSRNLYST
jgi:glycosyltransferase involved in cell wall biosynthesis